MLHEPPGCHYTDHDVSDWRIHKKTCAATLGTLAGVVLAGSFEKAYLKKSLICPAMICISRFLPVVMPLLLLQD